MIPVKWHLALRHMVRRMWFRAAIYGALGIVTALLGAAAKGWIPDALAGQIGADSVGNLLGILASSMLAVTTFSLSTMVAAYSSASSAATPRATRLLIADSSAQGALATFIGAFLFSVVGLIALSTGIYGDSGRVVLFAATILVILLITVTLLAWIEQLSRFGRLAETVNLVESVTRDAMRAHLDAPWLGAAPGVDTPPAGGIALEGAVIGYVEHVDVARLSSLASEAGATIHVAARPGVFVAPGRPLAWWVGPAPGAAQAETVRDAFAIADERSFEQDPRYGFVVLTEVGLRALSPSTNDPGTAIDVIGTLTRLMCEWARHDDPAVPDVRHARVFVPPVHIDDLFDDVVPPLARDCAGMLEVGIRLQKGLAAIAASGDARFADGARRHAGLALARALAKLDFEADRDALRAVVSGASGEPAIPA